MDSKPGTKTARARRRNYLVDRPLQLSVAFAVVGVLSTLAFIAAAALLVLPDEVFFRSLTGVEARNLVLRLNAVYFVLAAAGLMVVAIFVTHRVAGPARVIETALDGFVEGDFGRRLNIRKKDYLQSLAASARRVAESLTRQRQVRQKLIDRIAASVDEGDPDATREALAELARLDGVDVKEAPALTEA